MRNQFVVRHIDAGAHRLADATQRFNEACGLLGLLFRILICSLRQAITSLVQATEAYAILSDPKRRARYERHQPSAGRWGGGYYSGAYSDAGRDSGAAHERWRATDMSGRATGAGARPQPRFAMLRSSLLGSCAALSAVVAYSVLTQNVSADQFPALRRPARTAVARPGDGEAPAAQPPVARGGLSSSPYLRTHRERREGSAAGRTLAGDGPAPSADGGSGSARSKDYEQWVLHQIDVADRAATAAHAAASAAATAAAAAAETAARAAAAAQRARVATIPGKVAAAAVNARSEADLAEKYASAAQVLAAGAEEAVMGGQPFLPGAASVYVAVLNSPEVTSVVRGKGGGRGAAPREATQLHDHRRGEEVVLDNNSSGGGGRGRGSSSSAEEEGRGGAARTNQNPAAHKPRDG